MSDRKHEYEIEIDAPASEVWKAISTGQGIQSWFAPLASVTPGVGGSVTAGWGPGMEFTTPIEVWEEGKKLRTSNERGEGKPPSVMEYTVESRGGKTVLRLVHSGFTRDASFDGEFESTGKAWPVFMKMLKHSVEQGVDRCRNVTIFRMLSDPQPESLAKLMGPDGLGAPGVLDSAVGSPDASGRFAVVFPQRNNAMMSVFCENCGGMAMLTITWLLYDANEGEAESVRTEWTGMTDRIFGPAPEA
jgi:uncharacterized protein YndB with AHSA1/START domain